MLDKNNPFVAVSCIYIMGYSGSGFETGARTTTVENFVFSLAQKTEKQHIPTVLLNEK